MPPTDPAAATGGLARSVTAPNQITTDFHEDGSATVYLPDGTIVEVPADYREHSFQSDAAMLRLHRRFPHYQKTSVNGAAVDQAVLSDAFLFSGGALSARNMTPADYAEIVTHPQREDKFDVIVPPAPPAPPSAEDVLRRFKEQLLEFSPEELEAAFENVGRFDDLEAKFAATADNEKPAASPPVSADTAVAAPTPVAVEPPSPQTPTAAPESPAPVANTAVFDHVTDLTGAAEALLDYAAACNVPLSLDELQTKGGALSKPKVAAVAARLGASFPKLPS